MKPPAAPVHQPNTNSALPSSLEHLRRQPFLLLLATTALLMPPLAIFTPLGLAPLGAIVGIILIVLASRGLAPWPKLKTPLFLLLLAILIWAGLSTFWAIEPQRSLRTITHLVAIFAAAAFLLRAATRVDQPGQRLVGLALAWAYIATLALLLIETLAGAPLSQWLFGPRPGGDYLAVYNRGASVLSVILWPALLASNRYLGRLATIILFVATVFVLSKLNSSAPALSVFLGVAIFLLAFLWRRPTAIALAAITVFLTLAAPAIPVVSPLLDNVLARANYVDVGINHRLRIWEYVAGRSQQRPFTGWGLDASRSLADENNRVIVKTTVRGHTTAAQVIPLHPHNASLQIWVELGLPGAILAGLLMLWTIRCVLHHITGRWEAAACFALITSALVGAELSFGIWQGWWQATLWLAATLTLALASPPRSSEL